MMREIGLYDLNPTLRQIWLACPYDLYIEVENSDGDYLTDSRKSDFEMYKDCVVRYIAPMSDNEFFKDHNGLWLLVEIIE